MVNKVALAMGYRVLKKWPPKKAGDRKRNNELIKIPEICKSASNSSCHVCSLSIYNLRSPNSLSLPPSLASSL